MKWFKADNNDDLNYAVGISRGIMRLIGVWPLSNRTSLVYTCCKILQNFICTFLFAFIFIPGIIHMCFREKNAKRRMKMLGPLCYAIMSLMKYCFFLARDKQIRECIWHMKIDWKEVGSPADRRTMLSKAKLGRRIAIFFNVFMYTSGLFFRLIVPLSKGPVVTLQNVTIRPLSCPSYFIIFNEQSTPAYELVFTLQFFAGLAIYSVSSSLCGLVALLVMHACGQLKLLINRMEELVEVYDRRGDIVDKKMAAIVEHHIRVKGFLKRSEGVFQNMCLVEIFECSLFICILTYDVLLEWENSNPMAMFTYCLLLVTFIYCIFILCFIGEILSKQNDEVAAASCSIDWYRLPTKNAKYLILIIAISNTPMKITAGKIVDMSLSSFGDILKTSVAYFNILRQTL
ncbi:odorant receptor 4-like [Prorops nasuta]|uniref:odorant receptor 4-like n=1 Tax=Prorops nasuta TaxID=863751 RepID=UPI0034CEEBC3